MFIPEDNYNDFLKELVKLNIKLAKYNSSVNILSMENATIPFALTGDEKLIVKSILEDGQFFISGKEVELSFPTITGKQNVTYLGMLDATDGTLQIHSNMVENLNEKVSLNLNDACDHCKVVRDRVKYFFFEENGQIRKIGSTCAKEWFGLDIEKILFTYTKFKEEMENTDYDDYIKNGKGGCAYSSSKIIGALYEATKGFQIDWQKNITIENMWKEWENPKLSIWDMDLSPVIKKWKIQPKNDFQFNVVSSLFDEEGNLRKTIARNAIGVACWAIHNAFYEGNKEEKKERINAHIGNVGDKITFTGTPQMLSSWENDYGTIVRLFSFETKDGTIIWKSNAGSLSNQEEITMKGTIKEHSEFNGHKQTVVTRCRKI